MYQQITNYQPYNEQEAKDKELLLKVLKQKDVLTRWLRSKTIHDIFLVKVNSHS